MQNNNSLILLNEFHSLLGTSLMIGVNNIPNEKVLVLNDGIAKTIELKEIKNYGTYSLTFLFHFRDLITRHYLALNVCKRYEVGIRTVLAGGEKIQYTPEKLTGQFNLYYDEKKISEYGKKILETTFVYNPSEFQMNTAFAKAFTIESLGSKYGINVNGLYIEEQYLQILGEIDNIVVDINEEKINIHKENTLVFILNIKSKIPIEIKGLDTLVYHINEFIILESFDNDPVEIDL